MSIHKSALPINLKISDPENMHTLDRIARVSVGIGLFATLHPELSIVDEAYEIYLPLLAIYPLLTGLLAWDPIYELLRVRTNVLTNIIQDNVISGDSSTAVTEEETDTDKEDTRKVA